MTGHDEGDEDAETEDVQRRMEPNIHFARRHSSGLRATA